MTKLTYLTNHDDWEALYVDGEKSVSHHLGRLWPDSALQIIKKHDIDETEQKSIRPGRAFPQNLSNLEEDNE